MHKPITWILFGLTLLAAVAQVLPFVLSKSPDAAAMATATFPANLPAGYPLADHLKAQAFDRASFFGDLLNMPVGLLGLMTLLISGLADRAGAIENPRARAWLVRVGFFVGLFLVLRALNFPFLYARFLHHKAFGLTWITASAWFKLVLVGLAVPLVLFVLKYLLVTCMLPLCKRFWWLASALALFFISSVVPEMLSRTQPLDPIENTQPLGAGPHYEAMKAMLRKADLDLSLMVVDQSRRSKSANIWLTGPPGREYVVATDTFIKEFSPQQVSLALAHELGHLRCKTVSMLVHKSFGLLLSLLGFGCVFVLTGRKALPVSAAPRVVLLIMICSTLISTAFSPIALALSRVEERFADRFALDLADDCSEFKTLLIKVARHELEPLDLPPWEYYLSASHPSFLERIAMAEKRKGDLSSTTEQVLKLSPAR